jgi:hypothetical protein
MCPKEHQQKAATQPARKEKEKEKENERSSRRASVSRSKTTPLRVEKSGPGRVCRSWGPKNLRRQSEISTGSLAFHKHAKLLKADLRDGCT